MKTFRLGDVLKVVALCVTGLGFGLAIGCTSGDTGGGHHGGEASSEYDNKPWSIPEPWEGGAGLGGFGGQGR